jgi:hypothetical protein
LAKISGDFQAKSNQKAKILRGVIQLSFDKKAELDFDKKAELDFDKKPNWTLTKKAKLDFDKKLNYVLTGAQLDIKKEKKDNFTEQSTHDNPLQSQRSNPLAAG